jgi:hypothetical protein
MNIFFYIFNLINNSHPRQIMNKRHSSQMTTRSPVTSVQLLKHPLIIVQVVILYLDLSVE